MTTVPGSLWTSRWGCVIASLVPRPKLVARSMAALCAAGGLCVLAGYATRTPFLQTLGVGNRPLHPIAAVLFIAVAVYLVFAAHSRPPHRLLYGFGLTLITACIAALVAQFLGGSLPLSLPPDLATAPLGRLTAHSSDIAWTLAFGCTALAITLLHGRYPRAQGWMIVPLLPLFWATYLSLTSNFYHIAPLNPYFEYIELPLPAALLFTFLLVGFLAVQPNRGFMAALNRRYIGGVLATVAFPVILITPFTIGWLRIRAVKEGDYDMAAAFSQFATTNILIFGAFVWICAFMLNRIDARRQKTMAFLQRANKELKRVNSELQRVNHALEFKIEEQARTEAARQKTELQLFQSQKMEAMGTLASGIAHDFNNLLTVILLNTEDALEAASQDPSLRVPLGEIRKSGMRAAEVVRQIMTFGRKSPGGRSFVSLQDMVIETTEMLRRGLPRHVTLRLGALSDLPFIQADPTQIQQVLVNLGTNGAQAMAERGGILEFSGTRMAFHPGDALPHPDIHYREYVCLCVRDEGSGIDEENLARIFDPFFTTKPPGKGTGLGLSIVHGIMQLHHGCVLARSVPGQGSTFSLFFPVPPEGAYAPQDQGPT